ncbi:hypothetical protein NN561_015803 [Cricetulus griseus]
MAWLAPLDREHRRPRGGRFKSGCGLGDAQSAHAGSLPAVQGVQSRSAAAVQMALAHRGARIGRTQPRATLRAMGAGSPAERSAFGLRARAPPPLPATRLIPVDSQQKDKHKPN